MQLTEKHIQVITSYIDTNQKRESWELHFGKGKRSNSSANASNFFKRPEVAKMVKLLKEAKEKALVKATESVYAKLYSEQIATDLELDIFHTKVLRGETTVQEVFAVKEKHLIQKKVNGKLEPFIEEKVRFKRVERLPSIREKQFSAAELYRRRGSYQPLKIKPVADQDDQAAAEHAKSGVESIERVIILSDGSKLNMPK